MFASVIEKYISFKIMLVLFNVCIQALRKYNPLHANFKFATVLYECMSTQCGRPYFLYNVVVYLLTKYIKKFQVVSKV